MTIRKNQHEVNWRGDEILVHPNYDAKGNALFLQEGRLVSASREDIPDIHEIRWIRPASPLLNLRPVAKNDSWNFMGYDDIVVTGLNVNGRGVAQLECEGQPMLLWGEDLHVVLLGDPWDGERIYVESDVTLQPLLAFQVITSLENQTEIGLDRTEIIAFNYDGNGTMLMRSDGLLEGYPQSDLDDFLLSLNSDHELCQCGSVEVAEKSVLFEPPSIELFPKTRVIALYARMRTPQESAMDHQHIELQFGQLYAALEREDANSAQEVPEPVIIGKYCDEDAGAPTFDRPALSRLLKDVRAGKVDHVMVTSIDRFTRSTSEFCRIISDFEKHGVSFSALGEGIDTSTVIGKSMIKAIQLLHEMDKQYRSERIKNGKNRKATTR
jgi:hypothetical protein